MSVYGVVGARVRTMAAGAPDATALAVEDGVLVAVGTDEEVREVVGARGRIFDVGGRTILPGFIDTHTHVEMTALSRHVWTDVRGLSRDAVLELVAAEVRRKPPGGWVIGQATFGQDLPTKAELDVVAPEHCVALRWSMHKFVVNEQVLRAAGIDASFVAPPGMRAQRDQHGALNGVLEEAWDLLTAPAPSRAELSAALEETLGSLFLANGVTTVHEIGYSREGIDVLQELAGSGRAPRLGVLLTLAPGHQPLADLSRHAVRAGGAAGADRFWYHGYKIFMDGGRDGAFRGNQLDLPAERWGLLTRLYPTLVNELYRATDARVQVYVHAIGDLSQELAVSAVERISALFPDLDHRIRIEHFFNESYGTDLLDRLVAAGGLAAPNPGFVIAEPDDPARRLPEGASKYALRTLLERQHRLPGNSDTAGAQPFTTNPWFTMRCMLELTNKNGVAVNPSERIDLEAALRAFTVDAAYSTFADQVRGSLEAGKLADFIVIDRDPFEIEVSELTSITTLATIVGGDVLHGSLEGTHPRATSNPPLTSVLAGPNTRAEDRSE